MERKCWIKSNGKVRKKKSKNKNKNEEKNWKEMVDVAQ
jgi:hypothetical protein